MTTDTLVAPPEALKPAPTPKPPVIHKDVKLGDDVFYWDTIGVHAGVIDPEKHVAKVTGIGKDGTLTLHVMDRTGVRVVPHVARDESAKKKRGTWHKGK